MSRYMRTDFLQKLFNASLTTKNHDETELSKPMIIFAANYMRGFEDAAYVETDLHLNESAQSGSQTAQIVNLIGHLIQNGRAVSSAYELLNFLLQNGFEFEQQFISQIVSHTMEIRNDFSIFRLEALNVQATLLLANIIERYGMQVVVDQGYDLARIHNFLSYSTWSLSYSGQPKKSLIKSLL